MEFEQALLVLQTATTELAATKTELAATKTELAVAKTELAATTAELAATKQELAGAQEVQFEEIFARDDAQGPVATDVQQELAQDQVAEDKPNPTDAKKRTIEEVWQALVDQQRTRECGKAVSVHQPWKEDIHR